MECQAFGERGKAAQAAPGAGTIKRAAEPGGRLQPADATARSIRSGTAQWRGALAGLAALALWSSAGLVSEARAQTAVEVWSATLTLGRTTFDTLGFHTTDQGTTGSLSDDDFVVEGTTYTVRAVAAEVDGSGFTFITLPRLPNKSEYTLKIEYKATPGTYWMHNLGTGSYSGFTFPSGHVSGESVAVKLERGDGTAPRVSSITRQTPATSPTDADSLTWRVTFSEAVSNVDAADFAIAGTTATLTVSAVTGMTGVYDVTASGGDLANLNATVTLSFASGQNIADSAGNTLTNTTPTGTNDASFVVENPPPTVSVADARANENPPPTVSVADARANEGDTLSFAVTVSQPLDQPVTVRYATSLLTQTTADAVASVDDFTGVSGILRFAAGETRKTISVPTLEDLGHESNETFRMTLSEAMGVPIKRSEATGTIVDDDGSPLTVPSLVSNLRTATVFGSWDPVTTRVTRQRFTTGAVADGYALEGIALGRRQRGGTRPARTEDTQIDMDLCEVGAQGEPCTQLTAPSYVTDWAHTAWFKAPVGTVLKASTTYELQLLPTAGTLFLSMSGNYNAGGDNQKDPGSKADWHIAKLTPPQGLRGINGSLRFAVVGHALGVCNRTPGVRDGIVKAVAGVEDCADVTETHLAAIERLRVSNSTGLKSGDFRGLSALEVLEAQESGLKALPAGIFDPLSAATHVDLRTNELTTLPAGIFDTMTELENIWLGNNQLVALPAGTFDRNTKLTKLEMELNPRVSSLPDDLFKKLVQLQFLRMPNTGEGLRPRANAGPDQNVATNTDVSLTGTATGPWGDNVTYRWDPVRAEGSNTVELTTDLTLTNVNSKTVTMRSTLSFRHVHLRLTVTGRGTGSSNSYPAVTGSDWVTVIVGTRSREQGEEKTPSGPSASFKEAPDNHDGSSTFTLELHFTEEPDGLSYVTVRDSLLTVTGGSIVSAKRDDAPSNREWLLTLRPSGNGPVSLSIAPRACDEAVTVCFDGQPLAVGAAVLVPGPAADRSVSTQTAPAVRFDPSFGGAPAEHDGSSAFTVNFDMGAEPAGLSYRTVRDDLFWVTGGSITAVKRADAPNNREWRLTVEPSGLGDVTLSLRPTKSCAGTPGVCLADGRKLDALLSTTVRGPVTLSVADAEVEEAADASLAFAVSMNRARDSATTVDYATSNGTATAGSDYTATSGTLTFAAGETSKTVSVPVLDDAHDEGSETLTLTLSNVSPSAVKLADATATGTIANDDLMPGAWTARFGRTVAEQAVAAVEARLAAPRRAGLSGNVAGREVPGIAHEPPRAGAEDGGLEALTGWLEDEARGQERLGFGSRTLSGREALAGTSFALTGGTAETGLAGLWGQGAVTRFDGREDDMTLEGEVATATMGADFSRDALLAGLMLSHSRGEGDYRDDSGRGTVESTLTALFPYARYALGKRMSVWAMAGYGEGSLTLTPDAQAAMRPDMEFLMGAAGLRGVLVDGGSGSGTGGPTLAVKTDAMAARTSTGRVSGAAGNLAASEAEVTRLRLALEGSLSFALGGDAVLTPSLELGARHDGGDAETGFGTDIGAGLALSSPSRGLAAEIRARGLVSHEAKGLGQQGLSGSLSFDPTPGSDRGLSFSLSQTMGAPASGGADALFERTTLAGLGGDDASGDRLSQRFEAKLGYGFALFGDRWTGTPELGLGLSDAHREAVLGWRLAETRRAGLAFGLDMEAARREKRDAEPAHRVALGLGWRLEGAGGTAFDARLEAANEDEPPDRRIALKLGARW